MQINEKAPSKSSRDGARIRKNSSAKVKRAPLSHSHTQSLGPETAETQPRVYPGVGTPHLQGVLEAESPSGERVPEAVACPKCAPMVGPDGRGGPRAAVPPWLTASSHRQDAGDSGSAAHC